MTPRKGVASNNYEYNVAGHHDLFLERARGIENLSLFNAVTQMEDVFKQLHGKLLAVKHISQTSQGWSDPDQPAIIIAHTDDADEIPPIQKTAENHAEKTEAYGFANGDDKARSCAEEPEALQLYYSRKKIKEVTTALDSKTLIQVAGVGQCVNTSHALRMNPEWMELSTKCKQFLESSASGFNSAESFIEHSIANKRLQGSDSSLATDIVLGSVKWHIQAPLSPYCKWRMVWDILAALLLAVDAITLPLTLSWNVDMSSDTAVGRALVTLVWISLSFWTLDIILNFNTGFYTKGQLNLNRSDIFLHYCKRWFIFDVMIVAVDIFTLMDLGNTDSSMSGFRGTRVFLRGPRVLRAVRLLRLIQMNRFHIVLEEIAIATGRYWLLMAASMVKPLSVMLVVSHILACSWYSVGRAVADSGRVSWLEYEGALHISGALQYLHALQWLLTPPSPPPIAAANAEERLLNMLIVVSILLVMGSTLGTFTSALQELNAMNRERSRKRSEVRAYLQNRQVSVELTARIMQFVDYKLSLQDARDALDLSLISQTLQMELYRSQRGEFLEHHQMFFLTKEIYRAIYANMCSVLVQQVSEKDEIIFQGGEFAHMMLITALGDFTLLSADLWDHAECGAKMSQKKNVDVILRFSGVRWFAESSIFAERLIHQSTLRADVFCDAFTLASKDLCRVVDDSPACSYMFCEYAKDFLTGLRQSNDPLNCEIAVDVSRKAVKQNRHFMELHPDPNLSIDKFEILTKPIESGIQYRSVDLFIESVMEGGINDQKDLSSGLQMMFSELDPEHGSHARFSHKDELSRAESSCMSILNLVAAQYTNFTCAQKPATRLTEMQWKQLREIIQWISPTPTQVHAVLVLLAIKNLGKSKRLVQQLPRSSDTAELAVICLIETSKNVVPSVSRLDENTQSLLIETLRVHEGFNLAQMLQGENTPANLLQLKEMIKDNSTLFKFYLLFFLGFMSGLSGGPGSKFMNSKNAQDIILVCQSFEFLLPTPPRALYWNYMTKRARMLCIPTQTPEDLALVRLACLSRVQDRSSYQELRAAWMNISVMSREVLINHLLADGINERTFRLEFFPLCISNAINNTVVRLPALLEVTVELLEHLEFLENAVPVTDKIPQIAEDALMVGIDLSDMATFISMVKNRYVFQTCIMRSKIRLTGPTRISLEMTTDNWSRTNDFESDITNLALDVKQMLRRFDNLGVSVSSTSVANTRARRSVEL